MSLKNKFLCTSLALSIGIGFIMPSFSVSAATNISVQSLKEDKQINEGCFCPSPRKGGIAKK